MFDFRRTTNDFKRDPVEMGGHLLGIEILRREGEVVARSLRLCDSLSNGNLEEVHVGGGMVVVLFGWQSSSAGLGKLNGCLANAGNLSFSCRVLELPPFPHTQKEVYDQTIKIATTSRTLRLNFNGDIMI